MVDICLQGAAQGAWKYIMRRVEGGREERVEANADSVGISVTVAMLAVVRMFACVGGGRRE
jgi:hypothetical protein